VNTTKKTLHHRNCLNGMFYLEDNNNFGTVSAFKVCKRCQMFQEKTNKKATVRKNFFRIYQGLFSTLKNYHETKLGKTITKKHSTRSKTNPE